MHIEHDLGDDMHERSSCARKATMMLKRALGKRQRSAALADQDDHQYLSQSDDPLCKPVAHGLRVAVNRLIADNQRPSGPEIELCDDLVSGELRPTLQMPVLCIVQELLLNACRHSKSRRILVGIAQDDTHVYIQVQDWGVGFNPAAVAPNRRGLKGVCKFVQWLGGTVDIDTRLGKGTCIVAEIPLRREDEPAGHGIRDWNRLC